MATQRAEGSKAGTDDSGLVVAETDLVEVGSSSTLKSCTSNSKFHYPSGWFSTANFSDLDELQFLRLEGVDRQRRRIVRVVGKFLPATVVDGKRLGDYVTSKLVNKLQDRQFCIVYFHTIVNHAENSPGMLTLRRIYEGLSQDLRQNLGAIYVVHPGFRLRLLLATGGRFFLSEGFYSKLKYISRVEFLWDHLKKDQVEVPEFVQKHDEELENRPLMDYGLEMDPHVYAGGRLAWSTNSRFPGSLN